MNLGRFVAVTAGIALFTGATALSPATGTAVVLAGGLALAGRAWGRVAVRGIETPGVPYQFACWHDGERGRGMQRINIGDCLPITFDKDRYPAICDLSAVPYFEYPDAARWCDDLGNDPANLNGQKFYSMACQDGKAAARDCITPPFKENPPCGVIEKAGCKATSVVTEPMFGDGGYLYDNVKKYVNPPYPPGAGWSWDYPLDDEPAFVIKADYLKDHAVYNNPQYTANLILPFAQKRNEVADYCNGVPFNESSCEKPSEPYTDEDGDTFFDASPNLGAGIGGVFAVGGAIAVAVGVGIYCREKKDAKKEALDKLPLVKYEATEEKLTIGAGDPPPRPLTPPLEDVSDYCMKDLVIVNPRAEEAV